MRISGFILCLSLVGCASQTPDISRYLVTSQNQQAISVQQLLQKARSQETRMPSMLQLEYASQEAPLNTQAWQQTQDFIQPLSAIRIEFGPARVQDRLSGLLMAHQQMQRVKQQLPPQKRIDLQFNPKLAPNQLRIMAL